MNNEMFNDIYKDFFNKEYKNNESTKNDEQSDIKELQEEFNIEDIENLFIDDDSKELLKKIVIYMESYNNKEEQNYITFNIKIEGTDKETTNKIINIIKYFSKKYNYTKNNNYKELSLFKIEKEEEITSIYENGIISINSLDALNLKDINFKKKFFYLLGEQLVNNSITFISAKKEELDEFLLNDDKLSKEYFIFNIKEIKPSINDIYNVTKDTIGSIYGEKVKANQKQRDYIYNELTSKINISDEFNVELLDYITNTFVKSEEDYTTYTNNLYKYISFNKKLPETELTRSIDEVFRELNELVGLDKVKTSLNDLVDLITLKNKTKGDLKINNVNLHMLFLGNPGTGKTTVARLIADILYNLGYIKQNKLIEVSSKDLVAEYVGQTAVKTMDIVNKAMGGILFIDEAYALSTKNNDNSYNADAIATLIKAMEDYRDNLVVIFAGYTKEMQDFIDSNSGIASRIGYTLEFEDYTNDELKQIFKNMVVKSGFTLEEDALEEVDRLINENRNTKNFGNARFIRNVYEKTVINHAKNTKNNKKKSILKTITKKDITY